MGTDAAEKSRSSALCCEIKNREMKERAKQLKASGQWKKPEKPAQSAPGTAEAKPKKDKQKMKDQEKTTKEKKRKSDASAQVYEYSASSFTLE